MNENFENEVHLDRKDPDYIRWTMSRWEVAKDVLPIEEGGFRKGAIFPDNEVKEMMRDDEILRPGMILFNRHAKKYMTVRQKANRGPRSKIKVKLSETTTHELAELGIL